MGAEGAVGVLYRREINDAPDKEQARAIRIRALALLENKRKTNPPKKHGNIPL
jgi:acetyl-CoA carboxylase carboxyltransferase component